jgi:hypothetical protein
MGAAGPRPLHPAGLRSGIPDPGPRIPAMPSSIIRRRSAIRSLIRRCRAHGASALAIVDRDAIACLWAFRNA